MMRLQYRQAMRGGKRIAVMVVDVYGNESALKDARFKESDEVRPGVIAEFGCGGGVVRFEILHASKGVGDTLSVTLATA